MTPAITTTVAAIVMIASLMTGSAALATPEEDEFLATSVNRTASMEDTASLIIVSDASWSAAVMDSDLTQWTVDGTSSEAIDFKCVYSLSGMNLFSHVVQKQEEDGYLKIYVAKNGEILKEAETTAAYGVVAVSGPCGGGQ